MYDQVMNAFTRKIIVIAFMGLSLIFGFAYYMLYFKWYDCFNEMGRCFDADTGIVYLEQSGAVWLTLTALTSCVSLFQLWRLTR